MHRPSRLHLQHSGAGGFRSRISLVGGCQSVRFSLRFWERGFTGSWVVRVFTVVVVRGQYSTPPQAPTSPTPPTQPETNPQNPKNAVETGQQTIPHKQQNESNHQALLPRNSKTAEREVQVRQPTQRLDLLVWLQQVLRPDLLGVAEEEAYDLAMLNQSATEMVLGFQKLHVGLRVLRCGLSGLGFRLLHRASRA